MTRNEQPEKEDKFAEPSRPDPGSSDTKIDADLKVGEMKGGKVTNVEIATVNGPVYIQASLSERGLGAEDLSQPTIKTGRFEPKTVLIPAGSFLMGSDDLTSPSYERSQHEVELPAFRIGKHPVTVRQYAAFIKECKAQATPRGWFNRKPPHDRLDHPMTDVSWYDARAYCAWLEQKFNRPYTLPSEAEWEKTASWDADVNEKRRYPWGNEWLVGCCNADSSGTTEVNVHEKGASAYCVVDLLGNVQEWTRSLWGVRPAEPEYTYPYDPADGREVTAAEEVPSQGRLVHRGGYYKSAPVDLRCTTRGNSLAISKVVWRGFRVAIKIV